MNNETVTNITTNSNKVSLVELEALRDQIYGISSNLNMIYQSLDSNDFPFYASALEPALFSLDDACKKANALMEKVMPRV